VAGRHLLVVEDVITTGGQVVSSTDELRARGAEVATVLCVIDRRDLSATGPGKLEAAGLSVRSVFGLDDLLGAAGPNGGGGSGRKL
jgi:orotate phosphoribosyltransferase